MNGTATSYATTGIQFGRWTTSTGVKQVLSLPLGAQSGAPSSWMYGSQGYLDSAVVPGVNTGPLSGSFSYALDGNTAPIDTNSGTKGTLTSASLTADFTNQTVSASLALTMGTTNWTASATGMSLTTLGQFNAYANPGGGTNTLTLNQNGAACATCGGNINGAFTGQNYAGAILSYDLYDNAVANVYIGGQAALTRNFTGNANPAVTNGAPAPTGQYWVADYGGNLLLASSVATSGGILTGYSMPSATVASGITQSSATSVSCASCTTNPAGDVANSGIYYGTWDSGTYSSVSTVSWTSAPGQFHWITGPEVGPVYLAQALTGTMNFTLDGGTLPTNQAGMAGSLNSGSLVVNFNKQTVGISLGLADNGHTWSVTTPVGNEAPLSGVSGIGSTAFYAYGNTTATTGSGVVLITVDGAAASGNLSGQLTGTGLTGAMLDYNLSGTVTVPTTATETVNGVAAFAAAAASSTATPYQFVGVSATDSVLSATATAASVSSTGAAFDATSRVSASGGGLTGFDVNPINGGSSASLTLAINTSTPVDTGSDPATGITWGRWQGGTVNVTDRATGTVTPVTLTSSLHWISGPVATSPVTLPTSGTYAYTLAGGTHPT
ncbi:MAG: beta strand repeat-containing protein, partial [Burkholderiales bacterium]